MDQVYKINVNLVAIKILQYCTYIRVHTLPQYFVFTADNPCLLHLYGENVIFMEVQSHFHSRSEGKKNQIVHVKINCMFPFEA